MTLGQATCGCQARNVTSPTLPGKDHDYDEDEEEEEEGKSDWDPYNNYAGEDDEGQGDVDEEKS